MDNVLQYMCSEPFNIISAGSANSTEEDLLVEVNVTNSTTTTDEANPREAMPCPHPAYYSCFTLLILLAASLLAQVILFYYINWYISVSILVYHTDDILRIQSFRKK